MKYDIFISYKRGGSSNATAAYLYDLLMKKGYSVFFDRKEIRQGQFNTQLFETIENATDIIILLDDHSLKACFSDIKDTYKTDWFCMEVMHALLHQKRIIPLLLEGYLMPDAEVLPEEMKSLSLQNAISLDITDIEDFYKKYLIDKQYLASKPRNLYLSQTKGEGIADFLFYSDGECDLFECGNLIGTLNQNNDEDHPYRHPVQRCGEHRFLCRNNDSCEEIRITDSIDVNSQKYICIKWADKQNLWELSEDEIHRQNDSRILYTWGKGLFEGTSKHESNPKLAFLCLKEAANKWNIDARDFIVEHVKGLFATDMSTEDRIAWYEQAIEYDSGDAYEILGRYYDEGKEVEQDIEKAFEYGKKALQLRLDKYGEMNADVAMSYHNLGRACSAKGNYDDALLYYQKAVEIRTKLFGEVHPELAKSLNNLGNTYKDLKRNEDALSTYFRAVDIKKELYGDDNISLATTYLNIGELYCFMGDYNESQSYLQKALDISMSTENPQNILTANVYDSFGLLFRCTNKYKDSISYYQKAIEIKEILSPNNTGTAVTYINIGELLEDAGNFSDALKYYKKAEKINKSAFGENNLNSALPLLRMGETCFKMAKKAESSKLLNKALRIYESEVKKKPNDVGQYSSIAWILHLLERDEEALPWAEKATEAYPEKANVVDTLACVHQGLGHYEEALNQFELCLKLRKEQNFPENKIHDTEEKITELTALIKKNTLPK